MGFGAFIFGTMKLVYSIVYIVADNGGGAQAPPGYKAWYFDSYKICWVLVSQV